MLDLSRSWTPSTATFGVIPKPPHVPVLSHGNLWYNKADNQVLQGFGGAISQWVRTRPASDGLALWGLQLDAASGGRNGAKHSAFGTLTRPLSGLSAFAGDSAYVLGGLSSGQDRAQTPAGTPLPGLVRYNRTSRAFANASAAAYYGSGSAQRGQMVHVPASGGLAAAAREGLFAVLGGYSSPGAEFTHSRGHVSFANITLYDPATGRWHWQTAQGDIPRPREEFCAAGALSTNGTYEM